MAELRIQLTKRGDGDVVLRCIRADGSATWQRHRGRHAGFFPLHDLTHYVVETELRSRRGFYPELLVPSVELALSAMTALTVLQQDGYVLNPF